MLIVRRKIKRQADLLSQQIRTNYTDIIPRLLSKFQGKTVGICYDENICDSLMHGKYDRPVGLIVTEKRIIDLL